jgi:predicted GNAT family N-acyltransferase
VEIIVVQNEAELKQAYAVRNSVFVDEQNVDPDIEIDEHEDEAIHFVGFKNNEPIAASRLRFVDGYGKLERICVLKDFRGRLFGTKIISNMEQTIKENGYDKAKLNAQTHAEAFYHSLGYRTMSEEAFLDAGIPHVTMIKDL